MGREDQDLANNILGSMLLSRYTATYLSIMGLHCPVNSNCSWDTYPTLGICNACAKLTDADWDTTCGQQTADCSYNIRGVAQFDVKTRNVTNFTTLVFESKEVPVNVSEHWFNISNPILTLATLRLPTNASATFYYPPENATVCAFYPCVRTLASTSLAGQADLGVMGSWRNRSSSAAFGNEVNGGLESMPDIYMAPSSDDLGVSNTSFEDTVYYISSPVANLMRTTLRSTLLTRVSEANPSMLPYEFSQSGYGNSQLGALSFIYIGANYAQIFDTVSLAATYYIRSLPENTKHQVTGYVNENITIIEVRWPWIILPCSLYILTVHVFAWTVWKTRGQPIWKNSIIPFLSPIA